MSDLDSEFESNQPGLPCYRFILNDLFVHVHSNFLFSLLKKIQPWNLWSLQLLKTTQLSMRSYKINPILSRMGLFSMEDFKEVIFNFIINQITKEKDEKNP